MNDRKAEYQLFLKSHFWREISLACKNRANRRCEDCKSTLRLHAHHTSYPAGWYKTTLEQLRCLCDACHRKAHGLPSPKLNRKQRRKAESRRRKVEKWVAEKRRKAEQDRRLRPAFGFTGNIFNGSIEHGDRRFSPLRMNERAC